MFIGFILSIVIIIFYAMHVSKNYARKIEIEELERRIAELEEVNCDSSKET